MLGPAPLVVRSFVIGAQVVRSVSALDPRLILPRRWWAVRGSAPYARRRWLVGWLVGWLALDGDEHVADADGGDNGGGGGVG